MKDYTRNRSTKPHRRLLASLQDRHNGLRRFWGSQSGPEVKVIKSARDFVVTSPRQYGKTKQLDDAVAEARRQGKTVLMVGPNETPEETVRRLSKVLKGKL